MILFLPESRPGFGSGHARRSFEAAEALESLGLPAVLGAVDIDRHRGLRQLLSRAFGDDRISRLVPSDPIFLESTALSALSAVVFDSPKVDRHLVLSVRGKSLTLGLDAGGPGRRECDYLIDALPRLAEKVSPNVASTGFLKMPTRRKRVPGVGAAERTGEESAGARRILVSFGGEDSRGLTATCVDYLVSQGIDQERIAITLPGKGAPPMPAVEVLSSPVALREELFRFDIVITAFGLTAFEALGAGAEVLLMHPTRYHRRLAFRHGFVSLRSTAGREALRRGAAAPEVDSREEVALEAAEWPLPAQLARICSQGPVAVPAAGPTTGPVACPVCGNSQSPVIARSPDRTHYRCRECTMVFARRFSESGIDYDGSYFFEEYRAQYGRSYVEDLPAITARGHDRLNFLERRAGLRPPKGVLDLGCAFGAFLKALDDRGYLPYGVDVSPEAIAYCRQQGFDGVWSGDLRVLAEARPFDRATFDLVSLWFVIEHFPDLGGVLELLAGLVTPPTAKPGGLLAFSTPNLTGISGVQRRKRFLTASPADHATVWSPRIARRVLRRFGFAVVAVRVTGHHPERFPGASSVREGGLRWRFLLVVSRLLGLGDTFEVVARRKRGVEDGR